MQFPNLLPGQEYVAKQTDPITGKETVVFACCTEKGQFFSCTGNTEQEVRDRFMRWLDRRGREWG